MKIVIILILGHFNGVVILIIQVGLLLIEVSDVENLIINDFIAVIDVLSGTISPAVFFIDVYVLRLW